MLKKVAILANGGDVAGFNAVIRGIVKTAENNDIECYGFIDGYNGLLKNNFEKLSTAEEGNAEGILPKGGSIIGSSTNANVFNYKVINENGEIRLNINSFIGKETIDKSQTSDKANITIKINDRYIYKDYEKYNITVTNNTNKSIKLCEGIDSNEICVVDTNEVEYNSILNEIPLINLELAPGMEKTIDIKFYKMYNLYRTIEKISFKRIILNPTSDIQKNNLETISIEVNI